MLATFRSELRKVFSVRSTYVILIISLALELLFAFYIPAFKSSAAEAANPDMLASEVTSAISALSLISALVGILLITHEYRYNTIVYTLTAAKSRTRVLLSKLAVITVFSVLFAVVYGMLAPALAKLGFSISSHTLAPQHFDFWNLLWRSVFACWGFSMLGAILAFIIRAQVGVIAALFLIPSMVENLLGLLLHQNQIYLPFSVLNVLLNVEAGGAHVSYGKAALVGAAYIVGGAIVAWALFKKRDAN